MDKVLDRIVQYPNRYRLVKVEDTEDVYDLIPIEGEVLQSGTRLSSHLFDSIAQDLNKLKGRAGTVEIDPTVTVLSPTLPPQVVNLGTPTDARLKFSLPDGVKIRDIQSAYGTSNDFHEEPTLWWDLTQEEYDPQPGQVVWTRIIINFTDGQQGVAYLHAQQPVIISSVEYEGERDADEGRYVLFGFYDNTGHRIGDEQEILFPRGPQGNAGDSVTGVKISSGQAQSDGGIKYNLTFNVGGTDLPSVPFIAPQGKQGEQGNPGKDAPTYYITTISEGAKNKAQMLLISFISPKAFTSFDELDNYLQTKTMVPVWGFAASKPITAPSSTYYNLRFPLYIYESGGINIDCLVTTVSGTDIRVGDNHVISISYGDYELYNITNTKI